MSLWGIILMTYSPSKVAYQLTYWKIKKGIAMALKTKILLIFEMQCFIHSFIEHFLATLLDTRDVTLN